MGKNNSFFSLLKDIAKCIFIGLMISAGFTVVILLIGFLLRINVLLLIYSILMFSGSFVLLIAGISFLKPSTLRPLDHKDQWNYYFKKLNIGFVIFFIGLTMFTIGIIAYNFYALYNPL